MSNTTAPYAIEQGEQIVIIPWDHLHDSKKQYRKRYPEAYIKDLSANIKAVGRISSPLLVRPIVPELFQGSDDANAVAGYEVISGHCRKRAGMLAQLPGGPCIIRKMTDAEAALIMISENLQRKDVHPIEEAEGFADMMKEHGKSADELAAEFGVSRSYIYGRLKLLQAVPLIRDACLDGKIGAEVALLISRLRHPKLQERALAYIKGKCLKLEDGGQESFRRVKDLLNEHFALDLAKAPFPTDDATLLPSAGTCESCPKRSGNAPEYEDVVNDKKPHHYSSLKVGPDVCTDPDCFGEKKVAIFKRQADALAAKGETVIDGNKARAAVGADGKVKGAYVALSEVKQKVAEAKRRAQADSKIVPPQVVTIQNPRDGKTIQAVRISDLVDAGVMKKEGPVSKVLNRGGTKDWEAERQARESAGKAATERNKALFQRVRTKLLGEPMPLALVRKVAQDLLDAAWGSDDLSLVAEVRGMKEERDLEQAIVHMDGAQLTSVIADLVLTRHAVQDGYTSEQPDNLEDMARELGVDLEAPEAPQPLQAAAQAQEVEGPGGGGESAEDEGSMTPLCRPFPDPDTHAPAAPAPVLTPAAAWPFPTKNAGTPTPSPAAQAQKKAKPAKAATKTEQPAGSAGEEVKVEAGGLAAAGGAPATAEASEEAVA